MAGKGHSILVIGTSAGGLGALDALIGQLPALLPVSVFIVQHMAPESTGDELLYKLSRHGAFACKLASDGEAFQPGCLYIAPPDYHLLVKEKTLLVTKGARENRFRPAIDPLFRSAAVTHGAGVIGVVLTGMLDDGTAGLIAIKKCGGLTVVQDPKDAAYPAMPQSALDGLKVDHAVPLAEMGRLLVKLIRQPRGEARPVPANVRIEATIAERVLSDVGQVDGLGTQVPYNCPNCGGVLWEMAKSKARRYRCHTGHSFTEAALLTSQNEKIEETLWISLRMFEERKNLLNTMLRNETRSAAKLAYAERAKDTDSQIERIRALLLKREAPAGRPARKKPRRANAEV
jgi:two-component system chemotaxis response regulator CheB